MDGGEKIQSSHLTAFQHEEESGQLICGGFAKKVRRQALKQLRFACLYCRFKLVDLTVGSSIAKAGKLCLWRNRAMIKIGGSLASRTAR